MAWLTVNGIEIRKLVAASQQPESARRDVGDEAVAADGSTRVTRQVRKRDLKFTSVPLNGADAFAWEGLLVGDSNVWAFDTSFYSSKGIGGSGTGASVQSTTKKYGAGALKVTSTNHWTSSGLGAPATGFTIAMWASHATALTFHHYAMAYDGVTETKWVDGVLTPGFDFDDLASIGSGELTLNTGTFAEDTYFDDVVVSPFLWLPDWAAQVAAAGRAFGPSPFLTCAGDLVREATTRSMVCSQISDKILRAAPGGTLVRDARVMSVELKGA